MLIFALKQAPLLVFLVSRCKFTPQEGCSDLFDLSSSDSHTNNWSVSRLGTSCFTKKKKKGFFSAHISNKWTLKWISLVSSSLFCSTLHLLTVVDMNLSSNLSLVGCNYQLVPGGASVLPLKPSSQCLCCSVHLSSCSFPSSPEAL